MTHALINILKRYHNIPCIYVREYAREFVLTLEKKRIIAILRKLNILELDT